MRVAMLIFFVVLFGFAKPSRLPLEVTYSSKTLADCHNTFVTLSGVEGFRMTAGSDSVKADTLVALAKSQLGKNYCYAVSDPEKGFDCSGFVYFVFNSFKINVPRSSKLYKNFGRKIPMDSARVGDVIVFTGTNAKRRSPGHLGIILKCENGIPTFIHSSSGKKKGVIISDFNESPYYKKRFIKIVRVAIVY